MNVADNGIVAAKKNQMSISQRKLHGINYRPICFWQEQHVDQ